MPDFSARLIHWQKTHGRHDLPWQNTADPYAIWVSEIMLQQTQVSAVIAYYAKFMQRFPSIASLAKATELEVLQYWSGLGYYSRARNLHKSANIIAQQYQGVFPTNFAQIQTLPGIGRSTAAAIVSFAFNQTQTILDGNVKRVLARYFLIEGWPSAPKIERQLWQLAEKLLPENEMIAYTQGLMDLGATLCTRSKPKCCACPLAKNCQALLLQKTHELPTPKPRKTIPQKSTAMLIFQHEQKIMLEKRPSSGIWGGLLCFPEIPQMQKADNLPDYTQQQFGLSAMFVQTLPTIQHTFTHFKLAIEPQVFKVNNFHAMQSGTNYTWLNLEQALNAAIPTPVRKILEQLKKQSKNTAII